MSRRSLLFICSVTGQCVAYCKVFEPMILLMLFPVFFSNFILFQKDSGVDSFTDYHSRLEGNSTVEYAWMDLFSTVVGMSCQCKNIKCPLQPSC